MTTVTYGLTYKRATAQYENATVHYSIGDDVREGETVDDAVARITAKVDGLVQARIDQIDAELASAGY